MGKRSNNYIVIIVVLLLVVAIIAGAGLCYLSWTDEYRPNGNVSGTPQSTETSEQSTEGAGVTTESLQQHKEEGEQEPLDNIKEENTSETNGEQGKELLPNTVTMNQIDISADGEYEYIKDGQTASHKGIDVSKYQKNIDWAKVAADGVEYAFIRVGCRGYGNAGTLIEDEKFHQNVKGALAQGIKVGAYFFSQALNEEEALEEAELVIKELEDYDITYPVAVDIERIEGQTARQDTLSVEERTKVCIAFCERIREAGYIPMVYGDLETFSELLDIEKLAEYDFWICETGGTMTFPYEFAVWQYSHEGRVDGITGDTSISMSLKEW